MMGAPARSGGALPPIGSRGRFRRDPSRLIPVRAKNAKTQEGAADRASPQSPVSSRGPWRGGATQRQRSSLPVTQTETPSCPRARSNGRRLTNDEESAGREPTAHPATVQLSPPPSSARRHLLSPPHPQSPNPPHGVPVPPCPTGHR